MGKGTQAPLPTFQTCRNPVFPMKRLDLLTLDLGPETTLSRFFQHRDFHSLLSFASVYRLTPSALKLGPPKGPIIMYRAERGKKKRNLYEHSLIKFRLFFLMVKIKRPSGTPAYAGFPGSVCKVMTRLRDH